MSNQEIELGSIKNYKDGDYVWIGEGYKKLNNKIKAELEEKGIKIQYPKPEVKFEPVDVNTRWKSYEIFLNMVLNGTRKSLIGYGMGGVGKTFIATKKLEELGLIEFDEEKVDILYMSDERGKPYQEASMPDYDYIKITGSVSAQALYILLYEHKDKLLIFDDCDSVLRDSTAQNIIKGACDTSGDGTIVYASSTPMKDYLGNHVPKRFKFKGRVAFISNVKKEDMNQAICSRSLSIDLTMNKEQTIDRLKQILHLMPFQDNKGNEIIVSKEDREAAMEFFVENQDKIDINNMNARTLGSVALLKREIEEMKIDLNWKESAKNIVS